MKQRLNPILDFKFFINAKIGYFKKQNLPVHYYKPCSPKTGQFFSNPPNTKTPIIY